MASNFRVFYNQHCDDFHVKLFGDFDDSSAFVLIKTLRMNQDKARKIFIHTSNLSFIHPFGQDIFQKDYTINKLSRSLAFTGEHGRKLAPAGSMLL